ARWIRCASGVHDGKLVLAEERLERREALMQTKKSVRVDRRIRAATLGRGNRNGGTHTVIIRLAKRHDDIQAVGRAALKQHHELLLVWHRSGSHGALQKRRHGAQTYHRHTALLQEISPRESQVPNAFATLVLHGGLSCPSVSEI